MILRNFFGKSENPDADGQRKRVRTDAPVETGQRRPFTQSLVRVSSQAPDALVLRDGAVVGAVGLGTYDDGLYSDERILALGGRYRELVARLTFDVQILLGTRPQNIQGHLDVLMRRVKRWSDLDAAVRRLDERLTAYIWGERHSAEDFASVVGVPVASFAGAPGAIYAEVALLASSAYMAARVADSRGADGRRAELRERVRSVIARDCVTLRKWQDSVLARAMFLEQTLQALQAPVRTLYWVFAYSPRIAVRDTARTPLRAAELQKARHELAERATYLMTHFQQMQLPCWRATGEELLQNVKSFYHPADPALITRLRSDERAAQAAAGVRPS